MHEHLVLDPTAWQGRELRIPLPVDAPGGQHDYGSALLIVAGLGAMWAMAARAHWAWTDLAQVVTLGTFGALLWFQRHEPSVLIVDPTTIRFGNRYLLRTEIVAIHYSAEDLEGGTSPVLFIETQGHQNDLLISGTWSAEPRLRAVFGVLRTWHAEAAVLQTWGPHFFHPQDFGGSR